MKIVAVINQKGGVGKTTTVQNLGVGLARLGKKTLLVDLDPQSNLTYGFGVNTNDINTTYELLKKGASFDDTVVDIEGISLIPASIMLAMAEAEFLGMTGREFLLKEVLASVNSYDFALIDCPPSLGTLTVNALTAADETLIPIQVETYAIKGVEALLKTIDTVRLRVNPSLAVAGAVGTMFDSRKNLNKDVIDYMKGKFGDKVFKTFIRDNISLAEAPAWGKSIFSYREKSYGATDYENLAKEFLER